MRRLASIALLMPLLAGCVTADTNFAMSCSQYVGHPLSTLIARQGPPQTTVTISKSRVGYVYTATRQTRTPSLPYYEVNYLTGVDNRRSVSRPVTTTCSGTYIVLLQPDAKQMIIDVWPAR